MKKPNEIELKIPITKEKLVECLKRYQLSKIDLFGRSLIEPAIEIKLDTYFSKFMNLETGRKNGEKLFRFRHVKAIPFGAITIDLIEGFTDPNKDLLDFDKPASYVNDYLTIKEKNHDSKGNEANVEDEVELTTSTLNLAKKIIDFSNLNQVCSKTKETISFTDRHDTGCHIDISRYKDHYWVEVEYTKEEGNALKRIDDFCSKFGIDPTTKDSRSWPEIYRSIDEYKATPHCTNI